MKKILIVIVLFFSTFLLLESEVKNYFGDSDSYGNSTFLIGSKQFIVPKNYMNNRISSDMGEVVDQINLFLTLPNFSGYKESVDYFKCKGWCNKIYLSIYEYRAGKSIEHRVKCYQSQSGAVVYEKILCNSYDALLLNPDKGKDSYYFQYEDRYYIVKCSKEGAHPSPGCTISADYSNDISYDYSFSKEKFDEWKNIDKNLLGLITGFEVEGINY